VQLFADFQSLGKHAAHDPLSISEVDSQLAAHDPLTISELAASVLSTKQTTTQQLLQMADKRKEAARDLSPDHERTSEMAVQDSLAEDPAEADASLRTTQLAARAPSDTETQLAQLESEIHTVQAADDADEADRTTLALHETQLQILQQMIATTQQAIEVRKSKLFAKAVAQELMVQLREVQTHEKHASKAASDEIPESLYTMPFTKDTDEETQQLAEVASTSAEVPTQELAMLASSVHAWEEPALDDETATQELDMLRPEPAGKKQASLEQKLEQKAADKIVDSIEHDVLAARSSLPQLADAAPLAPAVSPVAVPAVDASKLPPAATSRPLIVTQSTQVNEDELAKRVAEQLGPSIGATLTAQIMQHVEADIAKDEKKLETQIEDIAKDAAAKSLTAARAKLQKTTTNVVHTPTSTTTTIVKGPADAVDADVGAKASDVSGTDSTVASIVSGAAAGSSTTTTITNSGAAGGPTTTTISGVGAPVQVIAKPVHIDDESLSEEADQEEVEQMVLKQVEAIAWERHVVDERLDNDEHKLLDRA
jgi:hypothetical protein